MIDIQQVALLFWQDNSFYDLKFYDFVTRSNSALLFTAERLSLLVNKIWVFVVIQN